MECRRIFLRNVRGCSLRRPTRGSFRVRGDTIDVFPAEHSELALRIELFDDEIETLQLFDPLTGKVRQRLARFTVYPSSHYVTPREQVLAAVETIKEELKERLAFFYEEGKLVEAQRLEQRTRFDLEMLSEVGHCKGIENYSRHLAGTAPGEAPSTLTDYLPRDAIMFLDESHQMIGQLNAMYNGDKARKTTLVESIGGLRARDGGQVTVAGMDPATNPPELREILGLERSQYEGPIGILSVLSLAFEEAGIPCASVWASVPHYVHNSPSPKATLALLEEKDVSRLSDRERTKLEILRRTQFAAEPFQPLPE